jgi:hypothetical protein
VVLTMGAGDVTRLGPMIVDALRARDAGQANRRAGRPEQRAGEG